MKYRYHCPSSIVKAARPDASAAWSGAATREGRPEQHGQEPDGALREDPTPPTAVAMRLHGRSDDDASRDQMVVAQVFPDGAPAFVSLRYPGILAGNVPAMNDAGLVHTTNFIAGSEVRPGIPRYVLGHRRGRRLASLEVAAGGRHAVHRPGPGTWVHTNHLVLPGMDAVAQLVPYRGGSSDSRYRVLRDAVAWIPPGTRLDEGALVRMLASHEARTSPMRGPARAGPRPDSGGEGRLRPMRQLPDQSTLAGFRSAIFLFTRPFLLIPGVLGTIASAGFLLRAMVAAGRGSTGNVLMLVAIAPLTGFGFAVLVALPGFMILRAFGPRLSFAPARGETLVTEVAANHFLHHEGRGGRLYLTGQRLVFVPHRFNVQRDRVEQRLAGVREVTWANVLGPSGLPMSAILEVHETQRSERYVVEDAYSLGAAIEARAPEVLHPRA